MARGTFLILLGLALHLAAAAAGADAGPGEDAFARDIRPLLQKYCFGCHDDDTQKGGVNLQPYATERDVHRDPKRWETVTRLISDREMPPPNRKPKDLPAPAERDRMADWLTHSLKHIDYDLIPRDPGHKLIHRLSRLEYNHTVRDLFGVTNRPADSFPADGSGGGGFDNNASALFLPPILMEKYLRAADEVLAAAPRGRVILHEPRGWAGERWAARATLHDHAFRAFRRPVEPAELDALHGLFQRTRRTGAGYGEALRTALKAVLVSPHFLFRTERDHGVAEAYRINDWELATRLSYFLWSSMPDDALFAAARDGRLHEPDRLAAQVRRMLADPKARAFAENFASQWLQVRLLQTGTAPDPGKFPEYTPALREAAYREPVEFFAALLREDRPLTDLLDADYTWADATLARHYGLPAPAGGWARVPLPDRRRGGVLTMAGVLTLTSYPQRTSPVLRGKWVLEEILGAPPPPPPPNAGGLPPNDGVVEGLTFRQRLEKHRSEPACAACHARMDPIGFALENFDPIGRWRDQLGGQPVDAAGELPSGEKFNGPEELRRTLSARRDEFIRNLAEKMLAYALGRGLEYYDMPAVKKITDRLAATDHRAAELILAVAGSFPFQYRRDEPVGLAAK